MPPPAARATRVHTPERQKSQSSAAVPASTDHMAEKLRGKLAQMASTDRSPAAAAAKAMTAADVVMHAMTELARISGLQADHVSSVACKPDGWHVTVDLIELKRIPASTDVIAAYAAVFTPDGSLVSYHRRRRYFRDQMTEEQA